MKTNFPPQNRQGTIITPTSSIEGNYKKGDRLLLTFTIDPAQRMVSTNTLQATIQILIGVDWTPICGMGWRGDNVLDPGNPSLSIKQKDLAGFDVRIVMEIPNTLLLGGSIETIIS